MITPLAALIRYHELKTDPDSIPSSASVRASDEFRLLQSMPADLQKKYLRVSKRHGITAVAAVERGICTGCHMRQPNLGNEIEEDIHECQNCSRLLYDPDVAFDYSVG